MRLGSLSLGLDFFWSLHPEFLGYYLQLPAVTKIIIFCRLRQGEISISLHQLSLMSLNLDLRTSHLITTSASPHPYQTHLRIDPELKFKSHARLSNPNQGPVCISSITGRSQPSCGL